MKKLIFLLIAFMASIEIIQAGVQGALPGAFSVSATKKVYFSKGNLQYRASAKVWRFAENQWNRVGNDDELKGSGHGNVYQDNVRCANNYVSSTYTGWIDLFAWGTGNAPTSLNAPSETFTDWGVNAISNGGNQANLWRTLTNKEWQYLCTGRTNASMLSSCAKVNGVPGYVFLPDDWVLPSGLSFTPMSPGESTWWSKNTYSVSDWQKMEQNGAVFFPACGYRYDGRPGGRGGTLCIGIGQGRSGTINIYVRYWSATYYKGVPDGPGVIDYSYCFTGTDCSVYSSYPYNYGLAVRLVIDSDKNVAYTITWKNWDGTTLATTSVLKGATPSYTGATPTRPSTAQYAYTFSGWTPAITAATANKTYTATYTATPRYTITFNANGGLIPTGGNMGNTPSGHITTLSADRTSGTVVVTKDKTHFQTMTNDCPSREGYTFAGWYTDPTSGVQVYDNTGYRVVGSYWNSEGKWIGTSNVTLYAHWTPIPYAITVNSSNVSQGSASGGGTYDYGTNHQITATPNECYRFTQWSDGNTDNPRTITVTGNATYTAEFEQIQYTIEAQSADAGQGSATVTNP